MRKGSMMSVAVKGLALLLLRRTAWAQVPSETDRYVRGPHMTGWDGGRHTLVMWPAH